MGTRVLIIEDDQLIQNMYKQIFTFEKFDVSTAKDGQEGVDIVTQVNPDIILLDMMMPRMNGFQVLEHLKSDDSTRGIPVIMLSNFDDDSNVQEALRLGAIKYLVKSAHDPKEITEIVKSLLHKA
jgi:DNA-binding response OmpR family regulator